MKAINPTHFHLHCTFPSPTVTHICVTPLDFSALAFRLILLSLETNKGKLPPSLNHGENSTLVDSVIAIEQIFHWTIQLDATLSAIDEAPPRLASMTGQPFKAQRSTLKP